MEAVGDESDRQMMGSQVKRGREGEEQRKSYERVRKQRGLC